jgi:hypothetical protein
MLRKALVLAVVATSCLGVRAAASEDRRSFLPENHLKIPIGSLADKGITEAQFKDVLAVVQSVYAPIIAARGGKLSIEADWSDDTVNAYANQSGTTWVIHMYGGLARHQAVTQDGFAMVACHELGHHLGGFPKVSSWAANEGQADYYAPSKCMRRLYGSARAKSFTRPAVSAAVVQACAGAWRGAPDRAMCERNAAAGLSLATLLASLGGDPAPSVDTPDRSRVTETNDAHPAAQCRLDTYFQGALCAKSATEDFGQAEPNAGACTRSQGFVVGIRPRCWYKPPATEPDPALRSEAVAKARDAMPRGEAFSALQREAVGL